MTDFVARLEQMLDHAPCGMGLFSAGKGSNTVYLNRPYYDLVGFSKEEYQKIEGDPITALVYPEDLEQARSIYQRIMECDDTVEAEYRIVPKSGALIWIKLNLSVLRVGEERYFFASFVDISKEKSLSTRLSMISENVGSSVSILCVDGKDFQMEYANDAFFRMMGCSREDFLSDPERYARQEVSTEISDEVSRLLQVSVETGKAQTIEYPLHRPDGSSIWVRRSFSAIPHSDKPGCVQLLSVTTDISDQHKTEQKLLAERNMYQSILDQSDAIINVIDAKTFRILYANQAAISMAPAGMPAPVGEVCYAYITHRNVPCEGCLVRNANKLEYESRELELGSRIYRQLYKMIEWEGVDAILEYTEDITEQRQNLLYAEERKDALGAILSNGSTGIGVFRYDGKSFSLSEINETLGRMLGITPEQATGADYKTLIARTHEDDRERIGGALKNLAVPGTHLEYEFRFKTAQEGEPYIWLLGQANSTLAPDGAVAVFICYTDITERRRLSQMKTELEAAKQASRAKTEFLSHMSHDMRTPMNAILGMIQLTKDAPELSAETRANLAAIEDASSYLLSLINDTLDMSRIESDRIALHPEVISSEELVKNVLITVAPLAQKKHITLECVPINAELEYIRVDKLRAQQIFMNVLSNAVKFTPDGGKIRLEIECLKRENGVAYDRISVEDNGIGMSEEFLSHIFEPFAQEDEGNAAGLNGTGLGMSIVKSIVERMGGSIQVESKQGVGTKVTVYLNFERVYDYTPQAAALQPKSEAALQGRRILLVEDHPLNAQIAQRLLKKKGIVIEHAVNGQIAVEMFTASDAGFYDAILMDIRMPVMDGIEAARRIRALPRTDAATVPIIAMTANAYDADVRASLDAGMSAHLAKPIDPKLLYQTLTNFLAR